MFLVMISVTNGDFQGANAQNDKLSFSEFSEQVKQGTITNAKIDQQKQVVTGKKTDGSNYVANIPFLDDKAGDILAQTDIPYDYAEKKETSMIANLLISLLPLLIIVGLHARWWSWRCHELWEI